MQSRGSLIFLLLLVLAIFITVAVYLNPMPRTRPPTSPPGTLPTSRPTDPSSPTTAPATLPTSRKVISSFNDYLTDFDPRYAQIEPERSPLPIKESAAITLPGPAHMDLRGDLWLTHPDAPPIADILTHSGKSQLHLSRDEVVFVFWSRNNRGNWVAQPITRSKNSYAWQTTAGAVPLERDDYLFQSAVLLANDQLLVPTTEGVAALTPPRPIPSSRPSGRNEPPTAYAEPKEVYSPVKPGLTPVTIFPVLEGRNPAAIVFRPWDNGDRGSDEALLFGSSGFSPLPADYLPPRPVHIFSYTDGSNLILSVGEDAAMELEVQPPLSPTPIDEPHLQSLILTLARSSGQEFTTAQNELARFGPSAWPYYERTLDDPNAQLTEQARNTLIRLLGARARPQLGIFTLLPGPVRVVTRNAEGAIALYCFGGVNHLDLGHETLTSPALLIARPGRPTILAPRAISKLSDPTELRLQLLKDDILVIDPMRGLLRLLGLSVAPMLETEQGGFQSWIGTDRAGRLLFQNPRTRKFLLIDPQYPNPTPRLPAWVIHITEGETGWDSQDYPTIKKGDPWRVTTSSWEPVKPPNEFHTLVPPVSPTTSPALPTSADALALIRGSISTSSLTPKQHVGSIVVGDYLFLFTTPGRVERYSRSSRGSGWKLDATFTEDIPETHIRRIWLDPRQRICIAHDTNKLTILFPQGRVPPELTPLITNPAREKK